MASNTCFWKMVAVQTIVGETSCTWSSLSSWFHRSSPFFCTCLLLNAEFIGICYQRHHWTSADNGVAVIDVYVHVTHLATSSIDFSVTAVYYTLLNTFIYPYKVCAEKVAFSLIFYVDYFVLILVFLFFTFLLVTYVGCWSILTSRYTFLLNTLYLGGIMNVWMKRGINLRCCSMLRW